MIDKLGLRIMAAALVAAGLLFSAAAIARPSPDERSEEGKRAEARDRRVIRDVMVLSGEEGQEPFHLLHLRGRGFLGVELTPIGPELRAHFGAPEDAGVLVARVVPDSPAAEAGIRVGDVIASVDGEHVSGAFEVARKVRGREAGETVTLEVYRDGRPQTLTVTVREREREALDVGEMFEWREGEGGHAPLLRWKSKDCPPGCAAFAHPEAFEKMGESLGAIDWSELPRRMGRTDAELEKRLGELEKRLADLRQELERLAAERR